MRNKQIVLKKLTELENQIKVMDAWYTRQVTLEEKRRIYEDTQEIVDQIITLVNVEWDEG